MLVRFSRPTQEELEELKVILFLMEPIRKMFLAFLDPSLSALERLDWAFSGCYRLQYWYWERQTQHSGEKMENLPLYHHSLLRRLPPGSPVLTPQNAKNLYGLYVEILQNRMDGNAADFPIHAWLLGSQVLSRH